MSKPSALEGRRDAIGFEFQGKGEKNRAKRVPPKEAGGGMIEKW